MELGPVLAFRHLGRVARPWFLLDCPSRAIIPSPQVNRSYDTGVWGAPSLTLFKGGSSVCILMPTGLTRRYGQYHLHFIPFSCYRRLLDVNKFAGSIRSKPCFRVA